MFKYLAVFLVSLCSSQSLISNSKIYSPSLPKFYTSNTNPHLSNFSMSHGFSLNTNSSKFGHYTSGVYTNRIKYNFSERINMHSTFHLMSNNSPNFNNQNLDLRYNFGVEYKISENSLLYFQLSNLGIPKNNSSNYLLMPGY